MIRFRGFDRRGAGVAGCTSTESAGELAERCFRARWRSLDIYDAETGAHVGGIVPKGNDLTAGGRRTWWGAADEGGDR